MSSNIQLNIPPDVLKGFGEQIDQPNEILQVQKVAKTITSIGLNLKKTEVLTTKYDHKKEILLQSELNVQVQPSPCSNFIDFCKVSCAGLDHKLARTFVMSGKKALQSIMNAEKVQSSKVMASQIIWYLMDVALKNNEGFEEGTFVIEDKNDRFYSFLIDLDPYKRDSSHYNERSALKHLGLDIFLSKTMKTPLPALKRTLLFEKIENLDGSYSLFLKPENYSANPWEYYDFAMHAKEFVDAQARKLLFSGGDDQPNMHKERVPSNVLKAFAALNIGDMVKAKKWGISYMVAEVEKLDQDKEEIEFFKSTLNFSYNKDKKILFQEYSHLSKRTGREVYLKQSDLF